MKYCNYSKHHLYLGSLTKSDGKLIIININDIPQLKGGVDLRCLLLFRQGHLVIVCLNALWSSTTPTSGSKFNSLVSQMIAKFQNYLSPPPVTNCCLPWPPLSPRCWSSFSIRRELSPNLSTMAWSRLSTISSMATHTSTLEQMVTIMACEVTNHYNYKWTESGQDMALVVILIINLYINHNHSKTSLWHFYFTWSAPI